MTFQNEREEIAAIAEMLTDGEDIYFLRGGYSSWKPRRRKHNKRRRNTSCQMNA